MEKISEEKCCWNKLIDIISPPFERLSSKIKELRQISATLEAGREIDPKKLKKLAGSLDYWADKVAKIGFILVDHPEIVVGAHLEAKAFIEYFKQIRAQEVQNGCS